METNNTYYNSKKPLKYYIQTAALDGSIIEHQVRAMYYGDNLIYRLYDTIPCTGLSLNASEVILYKDDEYFLFEVILEPEDCNQSVTWEIDNNDILELIPGTNTCKVIPLTIGDCVITAICGDYTAECAIIVKPEEVPCTAISINPSTMSIEQYTTGSINVTSISPSDTTDKVVWTTSNDNISIRSSNNSSCTIYGISTGTCVITATCGSVQTTCHVNVYAADVPCTGISCNSSVSVADGSSASLGIAISPSNCTDPVYATSSNTSIADASSSGYYVYGYSPGSCTITVSCGNYSDTCSVTVYDPYVCTDIDIVTPNPYSTKVGNQATILAKPVPSTTTDTLSFSVGDTSILTGTQVDHEFRMTELKAGTTTVTVRCGSITKTVTVIVSE